MTAREQKWPPANEWIDKTWYAYIVAIKRNGILIHCINTELQNMLSERNQTQKITYYMIPLFRDQSRQRQAIQSKLVVVG